MSSRDFVFWLQGYMEIITKSGVSPGVIGPLNNEQTKCIQNHLNLVFKHEIDPALGGNPQEMQAIHDGEPFLTSTPMKPGVIARC